VLKTSRDIPFPVPNRRRTESYAVTVRRDEIIQDKKQGLHRIVTARQKTGTHASVPIPPDVAAEVIALLNGNPVYVFWTGSRHGNERYHKLATRHSRPVQRGRNQGSRKRC